MPVYTYRCASCDYQFDQTQRFSDDPLTVCPNCGQEMLHKVYLPVGIVFKGSGFYATDHRSPSGAPRTAGGRSEEKSGEGKSETPAPAAEPAKTPTPAPASTPSGGDAA
jgi:putative FmdB family regulatory protein